MYILSYPCLWWKFRNINVLGKGGNSTIALKEIKILFDGE